MSSILKALEKAEESQSVRRDGGPGGFKKPRERRRPWILPAAVLGGAAVAALATFAAMGGFSRSATPVAAVDSATAPAQSAVAVPQQAIVPQVENPAEPVPADAQAAPADASLEGGALQGASEALPATSPVPVPVSKPDVDAVAKRVTGGGGRVIRSTQVRPAVASAAAVPVKASRQKGAQASPEPVAPQPAAAQPVAVQKAAATAAAQTPVVAEAAEPVKPAVTHPTIRVTGIAWQKGSATNGAIVNGRLLQQGSVIDGHKVEQILEDKVVFSGSGGKFEIPLSAGQ